MTLLFFCTELSLLNSQLSVFKITSRPKSEAYFFYQNLLCGSLMSIVRKSVDLVSLLI